MDVSPHPRPWAFAAVRSAAILTSSSIKCQKILLRQFCSRTDKYGQSCIAVAGFGFRVQKFKAQSVHLPVFADRTVYMLVSTYLLMTTFQFLELYEQWKSSRSYDWMLLITYVYLGDKGTIFNHSVNSRHCGRQNSQILQQSQQLVNKRSDLSQNRLNLHTKLRKWCHKILSIVVLNQALNFYKSRSTIRMLAWLACLGVHEIFVCLCRTQDGGWQ